MKEDCGEDRKRINAQWRAARERRETKKQVRQVLQIVCPHTSCPPAQRSHKSWLTQCTLRNGRFLQGQVDKMKQAAPRAWKRPLTAFLCTARDCRGGW